MRKILIPILVVGLVAGTAWAEDAREPGTEVNVGLTLTDGNSENMAVNAGIDMFMVPEKWKEFIATARKLTKDTDGDGQMDSHPPRRGSIPRRSPA